MENIVGHVDFIGEFYGRNMLNVMDVIFSYFDGATLNNGNLVCKVWRMALIDCDRDKFYKRIIKRKVERRGLWEILERHEMVTSKSKEVNFGHMWSKIFFQAEWAKSGWKKPNLTRHYLDIEQHSEVKLDLDMTQYYIVQFDQRTNSFHFWSKVSFKWEKINSVEMFPPEDNSDRGIICSEFQGFFLYVSSGGRIVSMEVATGNLKCHHPFPHWTEGNYVNRLVVHNGFMASSITTVEKGDANSDLFIWQVRKDFIVDWKLYLRLKNVNLQDVTITMDAKFFVFFQLFEPHRKLCSYDVRRMNTPSTTFRHFSFGSEEELYSSSSVYINGFIFHVSKNNAINMFEIESGSSRLFYTAPWTDASSVVFRSIFDVFFVCGLRNATNPILFSTRKHDYSLLNVAAWRIEDLGSPTSFANISLPFPSPRFSFEEIIHTPYSFHIDLSGISVVTENYENRKIFVSQWSFLPLCSYCREPRKSLYCCNTCKSSLYCNSDCQQHDWSNHEVICQDEVKIIRAKAILSHFDDSQMGTNKLLN